MYILLFVAGIVVFLLHWIRQAQLYGYLPPGPKGLPLLGNIDIPREYFWIKYSEIGHLYGILTCLPQCCDTF